MKGRKLLKKQEILTKLKSNDLETQLKALDFLVLHHKEPNSEEIMDEDLISEIIKQFVQSEGRPFMAERIVNLGSKFLAPIKEIMKNSSNQEVKVLSAMILATHHLDDGIDILLQEVERGKGLYGVVFKFIDTEKNPEIIPLIQKKLRECPVDQIYLVNKYLDQLFKRTGSIPKDIVERFSESDIPWQIKATLKLINRKPSKG